MNIGSRLKSALDVSSSIALIIAAAALAWTVLTRESAPAEAEFIESLNGIRLDPARMTNAIGSGQVVMIEFTDFQCPFCGRYDREVFPRVKETLIDSGTVQYAAFHFPLQAIHPLALEAGEAAGCAGRQQRFWEMRARLFAEPDNLGRADLFGHAEALTLQNDEFKQCLEEHLTLEQVNADAAEGQRLGVLATPTFFIGLRNTNDDIDLLKRIRGLVPYEVIAKEVTDIAAIAQKQ